ncbi:MAG: hypothetical protein QOH47_807 [Sphingomonadales bacterium]|jgi:hypothetical protein|nr:hypothetical protein [Sphingomonadales bacterium]
MAVDATTFKALGRTWRFKFGWAAICRLEERYDKPLGEIFADMLPGITPEMLEQPERLMLAAARLRHSHLSALIAAGLEIEADFDGDAVAEIMDELGLEGALRLIFTGQQNDLPAAKGGTPKKAPARPKGPKR